MMQDGRDLMEYMVRIRNHYLEMPGHKLTMAQIQKLCGLPAKADTVAALEGLVRGNFLVSAPNGTFHRRES